MKLKNRGQRDMLDQEQELRFAKARRGAIAREFAHLNPEQQRAVLATEGPLLLLCLLYTSPSPRDTR